MYPDVYSHFSYCFYILTFLSYRFIIFRAVMTYPSTDGIISFVLIILLDMTL
jgi:hypothetical protein